jgi:hypothetical protein
MECTDFQSEGVTPPLGVKDEASSDSAVSFEPLMTDLDIAEALAVGKEWVRSHAEEIPGFRSLGMYYRFHRAPFERWAGSECLLLPDEVADLLKVPRSWVYANADQIPGVLRLGRYLRFRPAVLRVFLRGSEACQ